MSNYFSQIKESYDVCNAFLTRTISDPDSLTKEVGSLPHYDAIGNLSASGIAIVGSVQITNLRFDSGKVVEFDGKGVGIGAGSSGSTAVSGGFLLDAQSLVDLGDDVGYAVEFLDVGVGGVCIMFWNHQTKKIIGVLFGGAGAVGGGYFTGSGKFYLTSS